MKRFVLITACIVLICAASLYFISMPNSVSDAPAAGGVLDLTGENFTDAIYTLDGEWEFYYGQLLTPDDFNSPLSTVNSGLINVPASWSEAGYPPEGFATYRLRILTGEKTLALYIPEISTQSSVWGGGELLYRAGQPSITASESKVGMKNDYVTVSPEKGEVEIVIQVSNYEWFKAGLTQRVLAGARDVLQQSVFVRMMLLAAFTGALVIVGVFSFAMYLNNRKDSVYLVFMLFCLVAATRFCWESNSFAQFLSRDGVGREAFHFYAKTFVLTGILLGMLVQAAFKIPYGRALGAVYILCTAITVVLPGIIPYSSFGRSWFLITYIPMALTVTTAFRGRYWRENPYNALYLISVVLMITWSFFTKVMFDNLLFVPGVVTHVFVVLTQCVMLVMSYAETKRREEELTAQTDFYRKMSHNIRTPLTKISTNIQIANRHEQTDHERLEKSQDEIMRIADMIDAALESGELRGERGEL